MSVGDQFNLHILALIAVLLLLLQNKLFLLLVMEGEESSQKKQTKNETFQKLVKKYGAGALFCCSTPIPDDLVYVPLGLAKYNPLRFFIATLTGKIVLCYVIVILSHYLSGP